MNQKCSNCEQLTALIAELVKCVENFAFPEFEDIDGNKVKRCRDCYRTELDGHSEHCDYGALLARTPADSLAAYRRKVLEEAAFWLRDEAHETENATYGLASDLIRRMAGEE